MKRKSKSTNDVCVTLTEFEDALKELVRDGTLTRAEARLIMRRLR